MRLPRRLPFVVVFLAVVGLFVGAFLLISGGGGSGAGTGRATPSPLGSGRGYACVTAPAEAQATAHSAVRAEVAGTAPVSVSERARVGTVVVTARLSERVVERALADRAVAVTRSAVTSARACAHGSTTDAARSAALTRAYRQALSAARAEAKARTISGVKAYVAELTPATVAAARSLADSKAAAAAATARPALALKALAAAQAQAKAQPQTGGR